MKQKVLFVVKNTNRIKQYDNTKKHDKAIPSSFLVRCQSAMSQGINSDVVSKDIGDPTANPWVVGQWITVGGEVTSIDDVPSNPEAPKTGAKSMRVSVHYPVRTFGGWNASPKNKVLPGKPVKLSTWIRNVTDLSVNPKIDGLSFEFVDANTNKFSVHFSAKPNTGWQYQEKELPSEIKDKNGKLILGNKIYIK